MADTRIGSKVPLVVLRDGKRVPVDVLLAERPKDGGVAQNGDDNGNDNGGGAVGQAHSTLGGLQVRDLTTEEKRAAKIESGVAITDVEEGSAAEDAGLQPGDIIQQLGGKPVTSATGFAKQLKDAKVKHAALLVISNGTPRFVALQLAE